MNTVIFARGRNIREQVEHCRRYAESKGYKVEGVIVGQAQELPEVVDSLGKRIDRVLVSCMSRISRNALEGYTIQADLELQCGAIVEVAREERQGEAFDSLMKNVIKAVKEEEMRMRIRSAFGEEMRGMKL
jgi:hypothetical protein